MIHINEEKNILRYRLHDDSNHAWVYFTLDLDRYELIISGEVTASYKWPESESQNDRTFIECLLGFSPFYLNMKLGYSVAKEFSLEKSIQKTIDSIKDYYGEEFEKEYKKNTELRNYIDDIKGLDVGSSESFVRAIEELYTYQYVIEEELHGYIEYVEEPPYWLKKSVEYFCEHIKPILKESGK